MKKRKFNSPSNATEHCWIYGKRGHFKDECLYIRCRSCKVLGHVITKCPTLPKKMREETKKTRRVTIKTTNATVRATRNTMLQSREETKKAIKPPQKEVADIQSHAILGGAGC